MSQQQVSCADVDILSFAVVYSGSEAAVPVAQHADDPRLIERYPQFYLRQSKKPIRLHESGVVDTVHTLTNAALTLSPKCLNAKFA